MELRAAKIPDVISLAQGIPSFDTPQIIKDKAIEGMRLGKVAKYSLVYGLPELREIIEQDLSKAGMFYDYEKEILVTCGAIEAITSTLHAILEIGDEVIIPSPSYTSYQEVIKIAGGEPVFFNLNEDDGWSFDIKELEKAITKKTKALLFSNPSNPTGTIFTKEQLLKIAELAKENNFYILSDEVYKDFIYDPKIEFFSLAQDSRFRKFVIRIFSFSKAYAMTGWRVGFLHADEEVVNEIVKIHDGLVTCAPVVSQYAAMAAIQDAGAEVEKFRQGFNDSLELICERLNRLNKIFSYQKPNSSYFVFPKILIPHKNSADFAIDLLNNAKVATVAGSAFGPNGEGHLRMNFGRDFDLINKAFDRMGKYFI
ncbi:MAG: aminotransferase class I/II-fold pyridoxal phosphate-dependent enzyme [bacterium]